MSFSGMSRLAQAGLRPGRSPIRIALRFEAGPAGSVLCRGTVRARMTATCQRCLGDTPIDIDRGVELILVRSDAEAARVWEDYEAYEVGEDERIYTRDLIEEELLLALPLILTHADPAHCNVPTPGEEDVADKKQGSETRENPFDALKGLRDKLS